MSVKIPETKYEVHEFITQRWSARSFSERMIGERELGAILEAASWSASSMNEQPWKFLYAYRGSAAFDKMHDCLMGGNQPWAANGSVLILSLAKKNFDRNGHPNRHAMHDVGAANTSLLLQAADLEIYGHMMGGFHMDKALETFDIDPNEWEVACFTVLGYLADPDRLEEPFKGREKAARTRKPLNEITQKLE